MTMSGTSFRAGDAGSNDKSGAVEQAKAKTGDVIDQAKSTTGDVVDQVKQTGGQVVDQAKQAVTGQVSDKKDQAADGLDAVADSLRQTGEQMRGQNVGPLVGVASAAADQIETLSGYLRDTDVNELIRDVEDFARRQPILFLSGAFALGLLGARFLKSSTPEPEWNGEDQFGEYHYDPQGSYGYRSSGASYPTNQYQASRYNNQGMSSGSGMSSSYGSQGTRSGSGMSSSYGSQGTRSGSDMSGSGSEGSTSGSQSTGTTWTPTQPRGTGGTEE